MYRNLSLLIALSAATTSVAAQPFSSNTLPESLQHASRHASHSSRRESSANYVQVRSHRHNVVAMAPTEAEVGDWRVKVGNQDTPQVAEQVAAPANDEPVTRLSILGMLAAAFGLAGMSIFRRMGHL